MFQMDWRRDNHAYRIDKGKLEKDLYEKSNMVSAVDVFCNDQSKDKLDHVDSGNCRMLQEHCSAY